MSRISIRFDITPEMHGILRILRRTGMYEGKEPAVAKAIVYDFLRELVRSGKLERIKANAEESRQARETGEPETEEEAD